MLEGVVSFGTNDASVWLPARRGLLKFRVGLMCEAHVAKGGTGVRSFVFIFGDIQLFPRICVKERVVVDRRLRVAFCAACRYEGLSDLFLLCPVPKLLLLAGTDRLDK